jgi:hypothetical protein
MKQIILALAAAWAALVAANAFGAKVNMPKEGNYAFDFCTVGHGKVMQEGDSLLVVHYDGIANLRTEPAGGAFDRTASRCLGTYTKLNGKHQESGVCEQTDEDGDKWWMDYHGNSDASGGTYTAVHGTGKYAGMTLKGEYRIDSWPVALKDVSYQGCNKNKGTYKLK